MMDPALLGISVWTLDVFAFSAVIECLRGHVRDMSEAIPLGAALGVEFVFIVVRCSVGA